MKMKSSFLTRALGSAAVAALVVPGTAIGQTTSPTPATPESAAPVDENDIVVTGIRGSIERAQDLKRKAPAVIEAVTFEDLGKFSDQNIADALQRVPGVQIERNDSGGAGDRAAIRGLGSQYVQVTVNQRTLVSFGNAGGSATGIRSFNLDQVPSEVIGGLTVYKTPLAETVEPGIGGLLDIATLRPLDYKPASGGNIFANATVRGEIDSIANDLKPRYSGGVGVKLFDNTLGIYLSGLISDARTRTDTINQQNFPVTFDVANAMPGGAPTRFTNVIGHNGQELYTNDFSRNRRSGSIGVQWKPTPSLDIYADFTYNKYSNNQERRNVSVSTNRAGLYGTVPAGSPPGTVPLLRPGEVTVEDGIVTGCMVVLMRNGPGIELRSRLIMVIQKLNTTIV
jgi:iron complex outermembrane recepter protein